VTTVKVKGLRVLGGVKGERGANPAITVESPGILPENALSPPRVKGKGTLLGVIPARVLEERELMRLPHQNNQMENNYVMVVGDGARVE